MSQEKLILEYLRDGNTLTPLSALRLFNCWALSSRISDLNKHGAGIKSKLIRGNGKVYAEYYLDPTLKIEAQPTGQFSFA